MEVQFRDGRRDVPPHLAELMAAIETYKLTYDQAVVEVNRKLISDHLNGLQRKLTEEHFKGLK